MWYGSPTPGHAVQPDGVGRALTLPLPLTPPQHRDTRYKPLDEGEESAKKYVVQRYIPNPFLIAGQYEQNSVVHCAS